MAASWNIFMMLIVLGAVGAGYAIIDEPVTDVLQPLSSEHGGSAAAQEFHNRQTEFWRLFPAFITIAAIAYAVKQTEFGARRGP